MDGITVTIVTLVSGFSNGDKGGKDYVMERKLWLIWVANSVEWISLPDTTALITVFSLGSPASCLTDFHQEVALSHFLTLLSKKELLRLLFSLFTLFLSFF